MNMPRTIATCLLLAFGAPTAASAQATATPEKKIYCWTEGGRKICGDSLPATATDAARTELSAKSGQRMNEVPRTLTSEERVAAAVAAKDAAAQAEAEAAARRRDLAMVESYSTETDLRRAYGERITLVDESLKTSRLGVANLRQSLVALLKQAADLELQSQPVRKPLVENIGRQHADLLRQQAIMEQQLADRDSLGDDLEDALTRYRALKSPKA